MKARFDEEEFNLRYRLGGGDAREFDFHRDSISQMGMAAHRTDVLYNAMRSLGLQVFDSNRVSTGCGGLDYHS